MIRILKIFLKNISKLAVICMFLSVCALDSIAQDAPVTTCAVVPGAIQGNVSVPLTVTGFTNIGAISLTLEYDYSVLQFLSGTPNPAMPNFLSGDFDLGNGIHRVNMGWFGSGKTLDDGSTIMTLNFNYTGGNSPLNWFDGGASCEYADAAGNVLNDIPAADFYINGFVCGAIGNPGLVIGDTTICQGQAGILYTVSSLPNVTGYTWTLPQGATIVSGQNTNSITVDYLENAVSGMITVYGFNPCGNGSPSQLQVEVNIRPIADAGNDTTINFGTSTTLHASTGGNGTFSYHWSPEEFLVDPDVQNPQTVILTSTTLFTLVVTNEAASSCQRSDEMIVAITGGPLSVNPVASPGVICKDQPAQLFSNAGSGSGNYTYLWTCVPPGSPPWSSALANPTVSPDSSTVYMLSVNDGYTSVEGSVSLTVYQLPTATISGGDTLCGTGNSTTLRVDLTGNPPWSFTCSNGITSIPVSDLYTTPFDIVTGEAGTFTLLYLQDANCAGVTEGSATVYVFPYPATPEITVIDNMLVSSVCCGNQWYRNNEAIPGETGQILTVTNGGLFFDIITLNGCSSDTSETVSLTVGVNEISDRKVILAPNPADDFVNVILEGNPGERILITITSVAGKIISRESYSSMGNKQELSVDVRGFDPGLYFVAVSATDFIRVSKLMVR
jgi:hypothetical protein